MSNVQLTSSLMLFLAVLLVYMGFRGMARTTTLGAIVGVLSVVYLWGATAFLNKYDKSDSEGNQIKDALNISHCKLIEQNIFHGYFTANTNKLDCNGTIKNISVSDYDEAIQESRG